MKRILRGSVRERRSVRKPTATPQKSKMTPMEASLLALVRDCPRCASHAITVLPAPTFGVQVLQRGRIVGVWSERERCLGFRNLASWQPRLLASTPEEALEATLVMASGNGWLG
jgi:hypothetical protein